MSAIPGARGRRAAAALAPVVALAPLLFGCGVRIGGTAGPAGYRVSLPPGPEAVAPRSPADLERIRSEVVARVNSERRRAGRRPLARDRGLERAAQRHAADMVARGFYSHDTPEGLGPRDRAERVGYASASLIGENIARGARSAAEAVRLWTDSRSHRRILLEERFVETGVGVEAGRDAHGRVRLYWVQLFAAR